MYTFELVAVFAKESKLNVRRLHFNGLVIGAMLHALHNDLLFYGFMAKLTGVRATRNAQT